MNTTLILPQLTTARNALEHEQTEGTRICRGILTGLIREATQPTHQSLTRTTPQSTLECARYLLSLHVETRAYAAALLRYHAELICSGVDDFCLSDIELRDRAECEVRDYENARRTCQLVEELDGAKVFRVQSISHPGIRHRVRIHSDGEVFCSCPGHASIARRMQETPNVNTRCCRHAKAAAGLLSVGVEVAR